MKGFKENWKINLRNLTPNCPRFVLMHLPGKITYKEIDEMIATVDKNEDWKISYSEFRVSIYAETTIKRLTKLNKYL